jgi:hypothetical protein
LENSNSEDREAMGENSSGQSKRSLSNKQKLARCIYDQQTDSLKSSHGARKKSLRPVPRKPSLFRRASIPEDDSQFEARQSGVTNVDEASSDSNSGDLRESDEEHGHIGRCQEFEQPGTFDPSPQNQTCKFGVQKFTNEEPPQKVLSLLRDTFTEIDIDDLSSPTLKDSPNRPFTSREPKVASQASIESYVTENKLPMSSEMTPKVANSQKRSLSSKDSFEPIKIPVNNNKYPTPRNLHPSKEVLKNSNNYRKKTEKSQEIPSKKNLRKEAREGTADFYYFKSDKHLINENEINPSGQRNTDYQYPEFHSFKDQKSIPTIGDIHFGSKNCGFLKFVNNYSENNSSENDNQEISEGSDQDSQQNGFEPENHKSTPEAENHKSTPEAENLKGQIRVERFGSPKNCGNAKFPPVQKKSEISEYEKKLNKRMESQVGILRQILEKQIKSKMEVLDDLAVTKTKNCKKKADLENKVQSLKCQVVEYWEKECKAQIDFTEKLFQENSGILKKLIRKSEIELEGDLKIKLQLNSEFDSGNLDVFTAINKNILKRDENSFSAEKNSHLPPLEDELILNQQNLEFKCEDLDTRLSELKYRFLGINKSSQGSKMLETAPEKMLKTVPENFFTVERKSVSYQKSESPFRNLKENSLEKPVNVIFSERPSEASHQKKNRKLIEKKSSLDFGIEPINLRDHYARIREIQRNVDFGSSMHQGDS